MPNGNTHRFVNTLVSLPLAGGIIWGLHTPLPLAISFAAGYTLATYCINPDLDLESDGYHSWGIFRFYWLPYQKILAHRSWLSHAPIVSTLLRVVYLLSIPILLLLFLGSAARDSLREQLTHWSPYILPYLLLFILGMIASDTLHFMLDITSTKIKRTFGRGSRRRSHHNHSHYRTARR